MDSYSWGDAFYIKKDLINNSRYIFSIFKNKLYNIQNFIILDCIEKFTLEIKRQNKLTLI